MPISPRQLFAFLIMWMTIAIPAHAKHHDTGFLDRTITLQGVTYKYQVYVPANWTPHQKWPIVLFLHGAGERGDDGIQQTDVGIGTAIRSNPSVIPAIVVMPQCRKNIWWVQPPMDDLAIATLEAATKEFHGDTRRTYLTGLSPPHSRLIPSLRNSRHPTIPRAIPMQQRKSARLRCGSSTAPMTTLSRSLNLNRCMQR